MRRIDKKLNMMKANLLAESRYLENKGLNETMLPIIDNFGDRKMAFAENEDELEEGFLNRLLDIPSKKDEAKKQQAIEEIGIFNFESLFYQPSVDENGEMEITPEVIEELRDRVNNAGNEMPTVKEFNSLLFEFNGKVSHAFIIDKNGEKINGIIPSCFEPIRDVNGKISNDEAKKRTIGYLG